MLTLTKMKRSFIIDHIMPSDLDSENIKNGLKIKEEMIAQITDDYIKSTVPDWKDKEIYYRNHGLSKYIEKINCGEMSINDVPKPQPIKCDVWIRYKTYDENEYLNNPNYCKRDYDFPPLDGSKDIVPRNGYGNWIKQDENGEFYLRNSDGSRFLRTIFQMQIVIYGDNHRRYYPYQDYNHTNGWYSVSDDIDIYDFEAGIQKPFYKLFFRNKKGYSDNVTFNGWNWEDLDWFKINYPHLVVDNKVNATTLLCDPFGVNYKEPPAISEDFSGSYVVLPGRQWLKINYPVEMVAYCPFTIKIDNTTNNTGV
jgi:hypothetical protein